MPAGRHARPGRAPARVVARSLETGIGADFGAVRVHTGRDAMQLCHGLQAQVFTYGSNVYMGAGRCNLSFADGRRLLAHELTHVVQQGAAAPVVRRQLTASPAGDAFEHEAEQLAGKVPRKPATTDQENPA